MVPNIHSAQLCVPLRRMRLCGRVSSDSTTRIFSWSISSRAACNQWVAETCDGDAKMPLSVVPRRVLPYSAVLPPSSAE